MTPSQQRYYDANKANPEFKARRVAAVTRHQAANKEEDAARKRTAVEPAIGERFEDWLQRWGHAEGRALFAVLAAARQERSDKVAVARKAKAAKSIDRVRAGKAEPVVQPQLASWRKPGPFLRPAGMVTSVFDLGQLHPPGAKTATEAAPGAGAERRDGGSAPMSDQQYRETTWRAPWAAPYALSRR